MSPSEVADLKTVVTEACTNVIIHAYRGDDGPGPLEVAAAGRGMPGRQRP